MEITDVTARIRAFRDERDWLQFHAPKEMAVAIVTEAAELLQHFVWKDSPSSWERAEEKRQEVTDEIADVGMLLFELADNLKIDLGAAILAKLQRNEQRYPADLCRGTNLRHYEIPRPQSS